jgi:RHS repeat-associated protein
MWIEHRYGTAEGELPYRFTGKEYDEETGFYYYGARYLDPRTSRWISGDPAMGEYIPEAPVNEEARKRNGNLPGMGGVYNVINLHVYHYAGNNPLKYTDPDGKADTNWVAIIFGIYAEAKNASNPNSVQKAVVDVVEETVATKVGESLLNIKVDKNVIESLDNLDEILINIRERFEGDGDNIYDFDQKVIDFKNKLESFSENFHERTGRIIEKLEAREDKKGIVERYEEGEVKAMEKINSFINGINRAADILNKINERLKSD